VVLNLQPASLAAPAMQEEDDEVVTTVDDFLRLDSVVLPRTEPVPKEGGDTISPVVDIVEICPERHAGLVFGRVELDGRVAAEDEEDLHVLSIKGFIDPAYAVLDERAAKAPRRRDSLNGRPNQAKNGGHADHELLIERPATPSTRVDRLPSHVLLRHRLLLV
jgi:hypothetical protein